MEDAAWDESAQRWTVRTPSGSWVAKTLILGAGGLSEPRMPDIAGIETFQGEVFHSARWNHDVDLSGKRVAIIGTGASSIQIVPAIQEKVAHLDVYQRTAPYVMPRNDRPYTKVEKVAFKRIPWVQSAYRNAIYWAREAYVPGFTLQPKLAWPAKQLALKNIQKGIKDPELRDKVTPTFEIGCKRILISNTYYPALAADNVDLVTDGIAKVTGDAIVTSDGVERPIDVLIVATGFYTTELPITEHLVGRSGKTLAQTWRETGMAAYKGSTVADFPNLFFIVGPNTGLGHSSMVYMIESQVTYIREAIRTMRHNSYETVEVKPEAQQDYNADLQRRMKRTVWTTGGCASWYLDSHGNNTTLWPRTTFAFRKLTSEFDADAYRVEAPSTTPIREGVTA
jgi:cyclohexanone monooxygenase